MSACLLSMAGVFFGCSTSEDSVPEYHGEHVVVQTEFGPVCDGTLAKFDHEIERIDAALGVDNRTYVSEVRIVGDEVLDYCQQQRMACVKHGSGRMYIHFTRIQPSFAHEAVHQRVHPTGANLGKALFVEGIAEALSRPRCYDESLVFSSPDSYVEAASGYELPDDGYYLGGELLHSLMQDHGPEAVLEFMLTVDDKLAPADFRAAYTASFGGSFDEDLFAHLRPLTAEYEPWARGCDVPEAMPDEGGKGYVFQEAIDCESPRVENDFFQLSFDLNDRVLVEWSIVVTEANAGYFALQGDLSEKKLTMRGCSCRSTRASQVGISPPPISTVSLSSEDEVLLAPGRYVVTWRGPLGEVVDAQLSSPCSFELADCPAGQQCTSWNRCEPEHDNLGLPGDSCELVDGLRTCVSGSRCVNGTCVPECSPEQPCPAGSVCGPTRVCGPSCDLLGQDCEQGSSCTLSDATDGTGQCLPSGPGQLMDSCHRLDDVCASGLVCGSCEAGMGQLEGCCVPLCETSAECPAEVPTCAIPAGHSVGVCV